MMKKTIFLLAAVCLPFFMLTSCSKDDDNGGSGSKNPEKLVVTGNATDITAIGATISGWANIDPAYSATAKFGIIVSEDSKPSYSNGTEYRANELNSDNSYHVEVTGLTPGTKYYYLSYVRIGENYTYGDVKSFSTKEFPKDMSITGDVTDITLFGATISAWANIDPAYAATAKFGIIVSEDSKPSYSNGTEYRANELNSDNSYHVEVTDLTPGTTFYYLSFVKIGDIYTYGDVRSFSTKELHSCPDNHHPHAIDLGLPSGTKWACCNVGASTPESYGGYYAWGETSEKSYYSRDTYAYYNSNTGSYTNIGSDIAGSQYDVAHFRMGNPWRMPSTEQQQEIQNCTQTWTQQNGVNGILVTGKNGGQIFLPAAGYRLDDYLIDAGSFGCYWSSSLDPYYDSDACSLYFSFGYLGWGVGRYYGRSVRAVCP